MDGSETADMSGDLQVVGCIAKGHVCAVLAHQRLIGILIEGVAAADAMRPQLPQVAQAAYRRPWFRCGYLIIMIRLRRDALDQQIDFTNREAGNIEIEIEIERGELAQLLAKKLVVPAGDFG